MNPRDADKEFVSPQELRDMLGFGETKTYSILREVPTYRIGKNLRVRRSDLNEWLEGNRRDPSKSASGPTEKTAC